MTFKLANQQTEIRFDSKRASFAAIIRVACSYKTDGVKGRDSDFDLRCDLMRKCRSEPIEIELSADELVFARKAVDEFPWQPLHEDLQLVRNALKALDNGKEESDG